MKTVKVSDKVEFCNNKPFVFIAGPCVIENIDHSLMVAEFLANECAKNNIPFVFKSSFDKANRSSIKGYRGIGLGEAIKIFNTVKEKIGCPVLTDVHDVEQCVEIGGVVDVLQIPAFLCRQTDLLEAAAKHGKVVNVKKGQFLAPWDVKNISDKFEHFGNDNLMLTERGNSFGYNTLVVDMTGLEVMAQTTKRPIIIDATHAVQKPGGLGTASGGNRDMAPLIARCAIAARPISGVFCEVHNNPDSAPSDGPNMLNFEMTKQLLPFLKSLDNLVKGF
jgi:2-dehydro-3-deoxyphosphooctonate aldolase (KDO 8-P synthase)